MKKIIIALCLTILISCNQDPIGYDWHNDDDTYITYYDVIDLALNKLSTEGNYNEGDDYEIGEIIVELDERGRAYSWKIAIGTVNWYELEYYGETLVSYSVIEEPDAIIDGNNIINSTTFIETLNDEYVSIIYPLSVSLLNHSPYYDNPQWLSESIYIWDDNLIYKERYYDKINEEVFIDYLYYPQIQFINGVVSIEIYNDYTDRYSQLSFQFYDTEPTNNRFYYFYYREDGYWYYENKDVLGTRIDDNEYSVDCSYYYRHLYEEEWYEYDITKYGYQTFTAELIETEYGAWVQRAVAVDAYTGEIVYCGPLIE